MADTTTQTDDLNNYSGPHTMEKSPRHRAETRTPVKARKGPARHKA